MWNFMKEILNFMKEILKEFHERNLNFMKEILNFMKETCKTDNTYCIVKYPPC